MQHSQKRVVGLTSCQYFSQLCDLLPSNKDRQSMVSELIEAYGLDAKCENIRIKIASKADLYRFHSRPFIDFLMKRRPHVNMKKSKNAIKSKSRPKDASVETIGEIKGESESINDISEDENLSFESDVAEYDNDPTQEEEDAEEFRDKLLEYGLIYDCPIFPYMEKYVRYLAGSTISTAEYIISKDKSRSTDSQIIGINWYGGRHHAVKSKASGFCYINDIVLGILRLRSHFSKIMYIDLDLHHGNGVESAFQFSDKVTTFSIHRYDLGFYPGSGDVFNKGVGSGLNHSINVPMNKGLDDEYLMSVINEILIPIIDKIEPDCLVIQCGCDGLATDEHKEWNLTIKGFGNAVRRILSAKKPSMVLGGGGYNNVDVARCWTYLTRLIIQQEEETNFDKWDLIPEHDLLDNYEETGFSFWKNTEPGKMKNENTKEYLHSLKTEILSRYQIHPHLT